MPIVINPTTSLVAAQGASAGCGAAAGNRGRGEGAANPRQRPGANCDRRPGHRRAVAGAAAGRADAAAGGVADHQWHRARVGQPAGRCRGKPGFDRFRQRHRHLRFRDAGARRGRRHCRSGDDGPCRAGQSADPAGERWRYRSRPRPRRPSRPAWRRCSPISASPPGWSACRRRCSRRWRKCWPSAPASTRPDRRRYPAGVPEFRAVPGSLAGVRIGASIRHHAGPQGSADRAAPGADDGAGCDLDAEPGSRGGAAGNRASHVAGRESAPAPGAALPAQSASPPVAVDCGGSKYRPRHRRRWHRCPVPGSTTPAISLRDAALAKSAGTRRPRPGRMRSCRRQRRPRMRRRAPPPAAPRSICCRKRCRRARWRG